MTLEENKTGFPLGEDQEQLALIDSFSKAALSSSSVGEMCQQFAACLREFVGIDWAAIALIDQPKNTAWLSPFSSEISSTWDLGGRMLLSGTPFAWVGENKRSLVEPDLTHESRFWTGIFWLKQGVTSLVHLPLFWQNGVYGVLTLASKKPRAYQERELRLLKYAASELALPLKALHLAEEARRQTETSAILSNLLAIVASSPNLPQVFSQFAQELRRVISFDRVALTKVGENLHILAAFSEKETRPRVGEIYPLRDSAIPWLLKHKTIDVETDFSQEARFPIDQLHLADGLRSEIRLPLLSPGRAFASLHLSRYQPYSPKEEELAFLGQLAKHISAQVEICVHSFRDRERLGWFAALSHHMRTPLMPIVSSSQLLTQELQKRGQETLLQLAQSVSQGAQRLQKNLELFDELAQLESPQTQMRVETFSPKEMLTEVGSYALTSAVKKSQLFILELPPDLPQISADSEKMEWALRILLDNAVQRSPEGGKIELRARVSGDELTVEVVDSGPAFSAEEKTSLLGPYHPSEADHIFFPELSLSLAICRRIIMLHDGKFWLESEPGKETAFAFSLPLISPGATMLSSELAT